MTTKKIATYTIMSTLIISCAKQANPEITLVGDEQNTIYIGDTWTEPGVTATDYKGKDITDEITYFGSVDDASGSYTLGYVATDKKGNSSSKDRYVSRGFKNTDLAGTYTVERSTNNGGGTQTYTGTITAGTGDITSITIDNSNSVYGDVIMTGTITSTGTQISVLDQSSNGCSVTNGQYSSYISNSTGQIVLDFDFATNCGFTGVYNHETTWTKQ